MAVDWAGSKILNYTLVCSLGEGGMAEVYRGEPDIGPPMAIKVLNHELRIDPDVVGRFEQEARTMAALEHSGIVQVYNFDREHLAIIMELVDGGSLEDMRQQRGPVPFEEALPVMQSVLAAVGYAHERGVIHRDLKTSNILLTKDGRPKVADFGIAKVFGSAVKTMTSRGMGTFAYMSPEQIKDAKRVDARSDLYALGVVFFELLAGRRPFESAENDDSNFHIMEAHLRKEPPDPRDFYPHIPSHAVDAVLKALEKKPEERFQTAAEFAEALAKVAPTSRVAQAAAEVAPASSPASLGPPASSPAREKVAPDDAGSQIRRFWPLVVVLLLALVIGGSFALSSGGEASNASTEKKARKVTSSKVKPASKSAPKATVTAGKAGIEWVRIPGGTFQMGSRSGDSDEKPVHTVTVSTFELAKSEVTVVQYRVCVDVGPCTAPDTGTYCNWGKRGREDHPINCVDWSQAVAFSRWVGGRLPTEAEWEYAARSGGRAQTYPWGDAKATCSYAVMDDGSGNGCGRGNTTWPVCSKPRGNSMQGVCDLSGNVWEWVSDWYGDYSSTSQQDPQGAGTGSGRVLRGGSWYGGARYVRAACRIRFSPGYRDYYLGFRPAR